MSFTESLFGMLMLELDFISMDEGNWVQWISVSTEYSGVYNYPGKMMPSICIVKKQVGSDISVKWNRNSLIHNLNSGHQISMMITIMPSVLFYLPNILHHELDVTQLIFKWCKK